ncbi:transporter [Haemophilus paracuniculus]|uniref:Transporter n=1 Tax=Haemophilus paracuniculus TaxID=734 RepID=A0A1T0AU46_9PAST|nr:transporter [Haemophilus paracuniculus]
MLTGAITLALTTAIGAGIGFGASYVQTPKWRATAQFDQPKVSELGNYFDLYSTYTFLNGGEPQSYTLLKNEQGQFSLAPQRSQTAEQMATESAYQEFKRNLTSPDVLKDYLTRTNLVKVKSQTENISETAAMEQLSSQFNFQRANLNKGTADSLSVTSTKTDEAAKMLNGFIQFANQQTRVNLNTDLIAKWKILFQQVKNATELKLGPTQQGNQIAMQDWNGKLNIMKTVQPLDDKLVAYRFVQSPTEAGSPIAPKRSIWAMIGALSGLLLGMIGLSARRSPKSAQNG